MQAASRRIIPAQYTGIGVRWFLVVVLTALSCTLDWVSLGADAFLPEQRFVGQLSDGSRIFAERPIDWGDETVAPKLGGSAVFDAAKPLRWLINQGITSKSQLGPYVEFLGGDRFPGTVTHFESGLGDPLETTSDYLVVEPSVGVDLPDSPPSSFTRVCTDWLKRIVWEVTPGSPKEYRPGTAFLRDGSQHRFERLRWIDGGIAILTDGGLKSLFISQLAELHFPSQDPWNTWFEQVGVLSPDLTARLIQVETADGMLLTASTLRYKPQFHGDRNKLEDWYPLLQPAWSLDPLVVPFRTIRSWRFFGPTEPPTTLFEASTSRSKPVFSSGRDVRVNRSVNSGPLKSGGLLFGWGFGVHAPQELEFTLHPVVSGFRVQCGLDQSINRGGCAKAFVVLSDKPSAPLFQSEVLIGPEKVADSAWLNVGAQLDQKVTLKLIADPQVDTRPAGADPFDIRDSLDWLEPQWRLDANKLATEVSSRLLSRVSALREWNASKTVGATASQQPSAAVIPLVKLHPTWDSTVPEEAHYGLHFEPTDRFVVLNRKMTIGTGNRWLAIVASRQAGPLSSPVRIQVRANGVAIGEGMVPERVGREQPNAILIPVAEWRGKNVDLSVVIIGEGDKSKIKWHGARLLDYHPGLVRLFDDGNEEFLTSLNEGEGTAAISSDDKQLGTTSLKITGGDRASARLPGMSYAITDTPKIGQFRYLRFAWKKVGGSEIGLQIAHDGMLGILSGPKKPMAVFASRVGARNIPPDNRGTTYAYQYDIGTDKTPPMPVLRLDKKISGRWEAYSRDLFGEFGRFRLTGLGFRCPDGEAAFFDGLYLARTEQDFEWASEWTPIATPPVASDPSVLDEATKPWDYSRVLSKVAPQFTTDAVLGSVVRLKDVAGREAVKTHPPAAGKPCVLRAPVTVPSDKKTVLKVSCGRRLDGDWQLAVVVEGQDLLRVMIDQNTAKDGWANHEVDLSRFAGKNIVVEVHNNPNSWPNEEAYWSNIRIE